MPPAAEFSAHGYAGTGLGAIVSRAGLTKGALFHHFPDKQALAAAWIAEHLAAAIDALWIAPLDALDSLDAFRTFCRARCLELRPGDATSALVSLTAETAAADPMLGAALESVFAAGGRPSPACWNAGKSAGWIHRSIQPAVEAAFLVAAFSRLQRHHPRPPDEAAAAPAPPPWKATSKPSAPSELPATNSCKFLCRGLHWGG